MTILPREEYVEQAYLYRVIVERLAEQMPLQELLEQTRYELLATAKLPMAIDFLLTELKHSGVMHPAMRKLAHYFAPFQTYLVAEAEAERGRFDLLMALRILQADAEYRSHSDNLQGYFFFQFETLCRNRLRYDPGLKAMSEDPAYNAAWREWLLIVRRQVGFVDLSEMIFVRSQEYQDRREAELGVTEPEAPILFGKKEGRIAFANHQRDPLYLFAAMQRHLGYPGVPRPKPVDTEAELLPLLLRRVDRLETRIKLMDEEQRKGALDLTKFYQSHLPPNQDAP